MALLAGEVRLVWGAEAVCKMEVIEIISDTRCILYCVLDYIMWYVGDNFANPHSQMRQQMKSRSCLGYIRFLLGWSEVSANGA